MLMFCLEKTYLVIKRIVTNCVEYTLENTEGVIKNGQSRETGNATKLGFIA